MVSLPKLKALEKIKGLDKLKALPKPMGKILAISALAWVGLLAGMGWMVFGHSPQPQDEGKTNLMKNGAVVSEFDEALAHPESAFENHDGLEAKPKPIKIMAEHGEDKPQAGHDPDSHHSPAQAEHSHAGDHAESHAPASEAHSESPHADAHHAHSEATHADAHAPLAPTLSSPSPEDGALIRQLVEEYAHAGKIDKALPILDRALKIGGHPPEFQALAARILMAGGRYGEAQKMAETALALLPQRGDLAVLAMMSLYRQGQVDEAMTHAMTLLQKQPQDVDLLTALGTMHAEQYPEDPTADGYLAEALKHKPRHLPALYQVGRREMKAKHYAKAEATFKRILDLNPGYIKAKAQIGMALYQQEKLEPARQAFITVLGEMPRDYNTWYNLGEVYLQQAAQASARRPEMAEALRQRAFHCYNQALDLSPSHAQAHFKMGLLLMGNNQPKEAARHFEYAVEQQSHWVAAWLQLSLAYEALEQFDKARQSINKAYDLDPLNPLVAMKVREWG